MALLPLIYAPNPIFRQKSQAVIDFGTKTQKLIDDMLHTMYAEHAVGVAAPMFGVLQRIVMLDLMENGEKNPIILINPKVTNHSAEMQTHDEASICFPYISAEVSRPRAITVTYLDRDGESKSLHANDFLATVIQHEMDYLDGKTYLDYLSKTKRDLLLKKMEKQLKAHPPHVHGEHCSH